MSVARARQVLVEIYAPPSLYAPHLTSSAAPANRLFEELSRHLEEHFADNESRMSQQDLIAIKSMYRDLRVVFEADLAAVSAYLVESSRPV